jgi:hypothetical protein
MPRYIVSTAGASLLDWNVIHRLAYPYDGSLIAVDGMAVLESDPTDLAPRALHEKREYTFSLLTEDLKSAKNAARFILDEALRERDKPIYKGDQLVDLINDAREASWGSKLRCYTERNGEDLEDLVISIAGDANKPEKFFYRDDAGDAVLTLLAEYTTLTIGRDRS